MSINRWTGKQNVVYLHNGIAFSDKKEFSAGIYYNVTNVETDMEEARYKRLWVVLFHLREMFR